MAFAGKDVLPEKKTGFTFRGNEIILSKTRGRPLHPHWKKGYYSDKERIEVVALYAATGSVRRVADLTRVSEGAIRGWLKEPWFHELLEEIRDENDHLIDAKFNEIIGGALSSSRTGLKMGTISLISTEKLSESLSRQEICPLLQQLTLINGNSFVENPPQGQNPCPTNPRMTS